MIMRIRLEFSYRSYEGQKGKEKLRQTDDSPIPCFCDEPNGNNQIPVTVKDVILQALYRAGNIVKEDVSRDSDFMMGVMDRVGKALLAYK
jgi:hypothetical protein